MFGDREQERATLKRRSTLDAMRANHRRAGRPSPLSREMRLTGARRRPRPLPRAASIVGRVRDKSRRRLRATITERQSDVAGAASRSAISN
ncbi:MAG TPA: hypothetical protein VEX70_15785 [Pyrinomonadaceae bacterium]|nr:hypothetical protein [Pyrinomonadaceae bacterium]